MTYKHAFQVVAELLWDLCPNVLHWSASLAVLSGPISTLQKQGSDRPSRFKRFNAHNSQVQWGEAIFILSLKVHTLET